MARQSDAAAGSWFRAYRSDACLKMLDIFCYQLQRLCVRWVLCYPTAWKDPRIGRKFFLRVFCRGSIALLERFGRHLRLIACSMPSVSEFEAKLVMHLIIGLIKKAFFLQ